MSEVAVEVSTKTKTKAKQRYLKAKRDRRKKRLASLPKRKKFEGEEEHAKGNGEEDHEDDGIHEDEETNGAQEDLLEPVQPEEKSEVFDTVMTTSMPAGEESKQLKEKRPKKRSKSKADTVEATSTSLDQDAMEVDQPIDPSEHSLPSFPYPTAPAPPSKAHLAIQGADPAFLNAEIVDPFTTETVDSVELSEKMRTRLKDLGIENLFAVQTRLLPFLLDPQYRRLYVPYDPAPDAAISAPTGSGKTLAYVIPIVEMLASRTLICLRALIVLPTRDLVSQVRETFESIAKGRGIRIASATGQHSFSHEQQTLVDISAPPLRGGNSKVDVLITTPGRLIDHIDSTPNFTLQHLRFLVIDEADRLLASSFQNWLENVLTAISDTSIKQFPGQGLSRDQNPLEYQDYPAPTHIQILPDSIFNILPSEKPQSSCQKLLFSATLTSDPGKIKKLNLRNVKYFIVKGSENQVDELAFERIEMPASLTENYVVTTTELKPLVLFHIVLENNIHNALVFTKSTESTGRLLKLWEHFESKRGKDAEPGHQSIVAKAYSSDLAPSLRKSTFNDFRNGKVSVLICSDLVSRGIDIPSITHVISYDTPIDIRKYVHRSGRTARAGREGSAWTLLEQQEARHFKIMLRDVGHLERVKKIQIREEKLKPIRSFYEDALQDLQASSE